MSVTEEKKVWYSPGLDKSSVESLEVWPGSIGKVHYGLGSSFSGFPTRKEEAGLRFQVYTANNSCFGDLLVTENEDVRGFLLACGVRNISALEGFDVDILSEFNQDALKGTGFKDTYKVRQLLHMRNLRGIRTKLDA